MTMNGWNHCIKSNTVISYAVFMPLIKEKPLMANKTMSG